MNKCIGIGRLTGEPEISKANSGTTIARYRLAVNRQFKRDGQPEADFLNCVVFGKGAEFAEKYLHKGMRIAVEGSIQTGSYEKDGVKRYTTDIMVDRQEFVESKGASAEKPAAQDGFVEVDLDSDDLPF